MNLKFLKQLTFTGTILLFIYSCGIKWSNVRLKDQTICSNYSNEPLTTLPVPLVHDMVNEYKNNQLRFIQGGILKNGKKLEDAHSIWFDLETLKKFIYQIENETIKNDKTKSSKDLGIRIYYATYPEEKLWSRPEYDNELNSFMTHPEKKQYGKYHTLLMVPTRKEKGAKGMLNIDFNPSDPNTFTQRLPSLDKYSREPSELPTSGSRSYVMLSLSSTRINDQNHGSLIPPRNPRLGEEGF